MANLFSSWLDVSREIPLAELPAWQRLQSTLAAEPMPTSLQSLGEVRDDLPASWLMESLIGIVVSGLQTRPSLGVEDTVAGITSLFLDGARLQQR